jgi:hypothetical protein
VQVVELPAVSVEFMTVEEPAHRLERLNRVAGYNRDSREVLIYGPHDSGAQAAIGIGAASRLSPVLHDHLSKRPVVAHTHNDAAGRGKYRLAVVVPVGPL